jgi:hypothetical protein
MGKQQWKLLLCALAAVATLVLSLFVAAWFRMDFMGSELAIDLRSASMCGPNGVCVSFPLGKLEGLYPVMSSVAFYTGVPVLIIVIIQTSSRLVTGAAVDTVSKIGYVLAASSAIAGFTAGYLFAPESMGIEEITVITVTRSWAPLLFIVGNIVAMFAIYLATMQSLDDDVGEYKPIKLDRVDTGRLPVTPLSVGRISTPSQGSAPAKRPSGPMSTRERLPDSLPLEGELPGRSRTPSSQQEPIRARTPTSPQQRVNVTPSQPFNKLDDTGRTKPPSQPPAVARTSSPSGGVRARTTSPSGGVRARSASQQPLGIVEVDARQKSPTQPPVDPVTRPRTSSSGPIDLAARLTASAPHGVLEPLGMTDAPHAVMIRPPLPQAERVPDDQIPVDPSAGLTIRKRTPSTVNEPVPASIAAPPIAAAPASNPARDSRDGMPSIKLDGIEGLSDLQKQLQAAAAAAAAAQTADLWAAKPPAPATGLAAAKSGLAAAANPATEDAAFPAYIQGQIKYAVVSVDISGNGLVATREDGAIKTITWDKIVGVIARRLPSDKPYEGATIVDVVSSAGSTVRVLPWTKIRGGLPLDKQAVERARGFVNLVAAQALSAKLDAATKLFADTNGQAAQLPTLATLGSHDERLA